MGCYHPLKGFPVARDEWYNPESQKTEVHRKVEIVPWSVDGKEVLRLGYIGDRKCLITSANEYYVQDPKKKPQPKKKVRFDEVYDFYYTIPCGQCIGCRLDYSRRWANRLMMELEDHDPDDCWFLTLTYDNDHLDTILSANRETGEATLSLCKRDVQLFHKRLREKFPRKKIRFFLAGEYGESTARPHYHGIYFSLCLDGFDPEDKANVWSRTEQGFTLYHWSVLDEVWSKGRVIIARVSWDTCAYTARYVCKKLTGPMAEYYENFGIIPEFTLMSRKPGIARNFYDRIDVFDPEKEIILSTGEGGLKFKPPRYFKELWKVDHELESDILSIKNVQQAENFRKLKESKNGLARQDWLKYLESVERSHQKGSCKLKRSDVY